MWTLTHADIKKRTLLSSVGPLVLAGAAAGFLVFGRISTPYVVLIFVLLAADIVAAALAWGAWGGGTTIACAAFATGLFVWDGAAVAHLLWPKGLIPPALLTVGLPGLAALAVVMVDAETGRPEGAGRWPLRREPLPLAGPDALIAALAVVDCAGFGVLAAVKGPPHSLVFVHCVFLATAALAVANVRAAYRNHVKWLLLFWGVVVLAFRTIPVGKGPLYAYTLVNLSKRYPVLHAGQLAQIVAAVALAWFARFHLERLLAEQARPWQKLLIAFLAAFGVFALREAVEMPLAASYPRLLAQGAYMAVFDLIFAGCGLLAATAIMAFQEKE
jgi:hypothetical protein